MRGFTQPRLWTKPLRELTTETSRGFEVIDFARDFLGVKLYPWQEWALIHGLELREDGHYRYRIVTVCVARQNGKTLLAAVLAAWWLHVDALRDREHIPPHSFKILGTAQNLDIAREPWLRVKRWCDPNPDSDAAQAEAIPPLQQATHQVYDANGKESIIASSLSHYEVRAARSARGKPAARVLMDELREQETWAAWNATSQTTKSFSDGQLWGLSNAGSAKSVVLKKQRDYAISLIDQYDEIVAAGGKPGETFDATVGLFEWSAPDGCELTDEAAICQANPSVGYGGITVETCRSDAKTMREEDYRTEVLCQWVTAQVMSYIDIKQWRACETDPGSITVDPANDTVWGVDVSQDRSMSYIASASRLCDGRIFVQVVAKRAGMMWLPDYVADLCAQSGHDSVAVQSRGSASMEWLPALEEAGLQVIPVDGSHVGSATGTLRDMVRDDILVTIPQPDVELAVSGGVTRPYAEADAWSRLRSLPVDIAPLCAISWAVWGLTTRPVVEPVKSAYADSSLLII